MKVVILAGGLGTRLSEETDMKPKPMVEIGGQPILWHIMKIYSHYGFNDFIICLGYKGYIIKEYFANYFLHQSDVTIDLRDNKIQVHNCKAEAWKITLIDTGLNTLTGGRIKRVAQYIGDQTFMLTYGDGVSSVNIADLLKYHRGHGKLVTVTATQPSGRFGALDINDENIVTAFREKPTGEGASINGGFFVVEPTAIDRISGDNVLFEKEPLEGLARDNELVAYRHKDFWYAMDTIRDKNHLESLWQSGNAPWKVWE